jgi:hypothetical protein
MPYVAKVNPTLHEIIVGTCTDRSIIGSKNKTGTTFIMPDNKELLAKIEKLAMSSNADDVQQAADIINSHVIRIPLRNATDWNTRKDNIPNSIYPSQRVEIEKATGDEVHFKSGAVAKLDKDFIQMMSKAEADAPRRALVVYRLTKGELPVTKDKPAAPIKSTKSGSYELTDPVSAQNNRFKVAITVENDYLLKRLMNLTDSSVVCDTYAEYTYGLVQHMLSDSKYHSDLVEKVVPLISCSALDFYLLVEPHRKETRMLLDDSVIDAWWSSGKRKFSGSLSDLKSKLYALVQGRPEACYSKPHEVQEAIDDLRQSISVDKKVADHVTKLYDEFISTNAIGDVKDVLPAGLIDYYRANPGLKLVQDEARYIGHLAFDRLEKRSFSRGDYEQILNTIGDYLVERGRNKLMNPLHFKVWIQPDQQLNEADIFINSTAFMYVNPMETELDVKVITYKPNEPTEAVFGVFDTKQATHQRLYGSVGTSNEDLIAALKSLDLGDVNALLAARGL